MLSRRALIVQIFAKATKHFFHLATSVKELINEVPLLRGIENLALYSSL